MKMSRKLTGVNQTNNSQYGTYTDYKDSNMDWLGQIPKHWDLERVRSQIDYEKGNNPQTTKTSKDEEFSIPYLSMDYLRGNETSPDFASKNENLVTVQPDDVLILWDGSKAGEFIRGKHGALSSTMAKLFNLSDNNWDYIYYLFKVYEDFIQQNTRGMGIPHVDTKLFKNLSLLVPTKNEQNEIVKFLDRETSKIDRLIEKQEKLIDLLEEKREALITKISTEGKSEQKTSKKTGIQWFKKIPSHWEIRKLKQVASIIPSNVNKKSKEGESTVKLCNYSEVYNYREIKSTLDFMVASASDKQIKKLGLEKNDVVITKDSESWDDIAVPAYIGEEIKHLVCGYHLAILRPYSENLLGKYLYYVLSSHGISDQFHVKANGVTRFGLSIDDIQDSLIPLPPKEEQIEIINYLDSQTEVFDRAKESVEKSMEKLNEYRTALISAAVTGKIDVRGEVE